MSSLPQQHHEEGGHPVSDVSSFNSTEENHDKEEVTTETHMNPVRERKRKKTSLL